MSIVSFFDQFPEWNGQSIQFRGSDGYVSVTDLNKAIGRQFRDWKRTKFAQEMLDELSLIYRVPVERKGREDFHTLGQKPLIDRDTKTSRIFAHPTVALSYCMSEPRFQARINAWIMNIKTLGTPTPHHEDWTAVEYLRGVEFNRDDIHEMYG